MRFILLPLILLLCASSCATTRDHAPEAHEQVAVVTSTSDSPADSSSLDTEAGPLTSWNDDDHAVAIFDLAQAKAQAAIDDAEAAFFLEQSEFDLIRAQEAYKDIIQFSQPEQIRASINGLEGSRNALQATEEELAQLMMLYGEDELADQTAEIVLNRARRGLEQQKIWFDLEVQEHKHFLEVTLPNERIEFERAVKGALHELEMTKMRNALEKKERDNSLQGHLNHLAEIEEELRSTAPTS